MYRYEFSKDEHFITINDVKPQAKLKYSRELHQAVSPGHIAGICVTMEFTETTERITVRIPAAIYVQVPFLRDCPEDGRRVEASIQQDTGERVDKQVSRTHIDLPGSLWHLLVDLKVVMDAGWSSDAESIFMSRSADVSRLAGAIQVPARPVLP